MKSTRKNIVVVAVVLAIVFAVSSMAMARGFGRGGGGYCAGPGLGGSEGMGPGFGILRDLNLSDEQRDQALKISEAHQISMIKARGDLIKAHDALTDALQGGPLNEESVRQAYKKLSSLKEDRLIARAKMMSELKAILTHEQVKLLDDRTADRPNWNEPRRGPGKPSAGRWGGDCPRW